MRNIFRSISTILAGLFVIYISLWSLSSSQELNKKDKKAVATAMAIPLDSIVKRPTSNSETLPFQDNPSVYLYDEPGSLVTIYITVRLGNASDNTNFTWEQVNGFNKYWELINNQVVPVGKAEAIVQFGDENGPLAGEVGYDVLAPNATIQVRGASTSLAPQKSYKVELFNNAGAWRGQSTINLNKHIYDETRFRNKLSYDLLKEIPDMVSLRTQFVHLYVKDETIDPP